MVLLLENESFSHHGQICSSVNTRTLLSLQPEALRRNHFHSLTVVIKLTVLIEI